MPSDKMEDFQRLKNTLGGRGKDSGKVTSLLAQARLQLDRNNFDKAKEYAEKALKLSPSNQEAQELITRANRAEKDSRSGKQREDRHKEARTKAEEAKKKMEEAKKKAAQAEARKSEEEERLKTAEEDAIRRAEEARRLVEEAEEKRKEAERKRLEEEERLKTAMEEARRAEEEARHKAEEARRLAEEEEARRRQEEEKRRKEEEERRRKAEEARNKAQEEVAVRKKVEQITKFLAQARMRISAHKFDEARSFIEKALEIDQGSREVQAMIDRLEKAEEAYLKEEALHRQEEEEKRRKEKVEIHLKEAEDLLGKNAFEEARGEVQEALGIDEANKAAKNFLKEIEKAEEEYKRTEKDRLEEEKRSKEIEEERKKAEEAARKRSVEDSRKRSEEEIQRKAEEARRIAAEELRKTAGIESKKVAKERRKKQEEEKKEPGEVEPTLFPAEDFKKEEPPSSEDLAIAKEREEAFRMAREESFRAGEEEQKRTKEETEERAKEETKKEEEEKEVLQKWMNTAEEHLVKDEFSQARGEVEKVLEADRKNREARVLLKRIVKAEKIKRKDEVRKQRREEAQKRAEEKTRIREEKEAQKMAEAEARAKDEEERKKKEEEEREKALEEARKKEEEEEKRTAEEEKERQKASEEEAKRQAEEDKKREKEEAKRKAEEEKKRLKEEEERKKLVEEARKKQEEEAKRQAVEEEKRRAEEEKRRKAEEEARKREDEERQKALEEARKKAEEETREKLKLLQDCLDSARVIVKEHKFDVAREEIQRALSIDPANREARRFMKEISRFERAYLKQQERLKREEEAKKREEEATRRRVEEEAKRKVVEEETLRKSQLVKGHLEVARESLADKEFDKAREYTKKALDAELGNKDAKKFLREIDRYERMYHRKEEQIKRGEENIKRSEEERKRRQEQEVQRREQEEKRRVQEEERRIGEEKRRAEEEERKRELEEQRSKAEEEKKREAEEEKRIKIEEENKKKELISGYLNDARQCIGSHEFDLARQDIQKALQVNPASREAKQLLKEIAKAEKVYNKQQERIKREEEAQKRREEERKTKEEEKKRQLIEGEKRKKEEEKAGEAQEEENKKKDALIKTVLAEAQQHFEGKRFEEARGSIQKALEINARSPEARNLLKAVSREEKLHYKELKQQAREEEKRKEGKPADQAVWLSKAKDKIAKVFESTLAGGKKEAQEDLFKASEEKEKPEVEEKKKIIPVLGLKYLSKGKEFITEGGWKKIDLAKVKKNYIWIILGILITTFILAHTIGKMKQVFFKGREVEKEGAQFMESIPVKVYKVKRMDFKDTLPVLGRIEGFKEIELRFGEGGILESFNFEEGERILEGDIIASLDQKDALLKLKYASIEMEKASRLLEIGGIDKAAADQKKLEYESAKRDLEKTNIYAASDGYLGSKETHTGAYVTPQDKIGVFVDFSEVYAAFDVIEEDSPKIELGQNTEIFLDAYPGATYKGTVDMVAPMIEGRTRTQKVKIELANENDELRPGMFARAIINTYEKQDALIIPASAFKKIENKYYVYVVHLEEGEAEELIEEEGEAVDPGVAGAETGLVEQREIKIVYLTHDVAEVGKGLEEGELVIREIHQEFKDKDKVEITEVQETIF